MEKEIKNIVLNLENATSERNISKIKEYLHKDYRVVANRFKGSKTTTIITKKMYLEMMKGNKIGGTSYQTEFKKISITEHTAIVDVLFKSDKSSNMHKYLILIQDENNNWKVVSDIPIVIE
ncbi:DUF4440 domain-containing protein [Tenacibaculum sp. ZS6-P6]|uniref:DUF4440 domain-containing protein n=1 Tax=Tenacibaculum sp. ZS6-P6 TaxID=3447503 RepID=UPI003F94C6A5